MIARRGVRDRSSPAGPGGGRGEAGARDIRRLLMLALCFAIAVGGLRTVIAGGPWWAATMVPVVAMIGVSLGLLLAGLGRLWATVGGIVVGPLAITLLHGDGTGLLWLVPSPATIERFAALTRDAAFAIAWQAAPLEAEESLLLVLGLGVAGLTALALLVLGLRLPALAAIPLGVLILIPAPAPGGHVDGWFFAGTGLGYLALLLIGRTWRPVPATAIASTAVVGALVIPLFLPSTAQGGRITGEESLVTIGVNPIITLGDDLRRPEDFPVLEYATHSGQPLHLRMSEISDFTGSSWGPEPPELDRRNNTRNMPSAPGLSPDTPQTTDFTRIDIGQFSSSWLPLPYPVSRITNLAGAWRWMPRTLSVASAENTTQGLSYHVTNVRVEPRPIDLQGAPDFTESSFADYLRLPELTPLIRNIAQEVTAEATTDYEKAVAIQWFLRRAPFNYSEVAPVERGYDGTGIEVIDAFLRERSGYCIHFAATMAVLAREAGIPSRIVLGFTAGSVNGEDSSGWTRYEVTTHDLHAWPELYFQDVGWVPFEPTPGRGYLPSYTDPGTSGVPDTDPVAESPAVVPPVGLGDVVGAGAAAAGWLTSGGPERVLGVLATALALVALLLTPGWVRSLRRRRTVSALRDGHGSAVAAWRELLDSALDVGMGIPVTLTPRGAALRLGRARGMDEGARTALDSLADAVEHEGYGPPGTAPADPALGEALTAVTSRLIDGAPRRTRWRARWLPASLLTRLRGLGARLTGF